LGPVKKHRRRTGGGGEAEVRGVKKGLEGGGECRGEWKSKRIGTKERNGIEKTGKNVTRGGLSAERWEGGGVGGGGVIGRGEWEIC